MAFLVVRLTQQSALCYCSSLFNSDGIALVLSLFTLRSLIKMVINFGVFVVISIMHLAKCYFSVFKPEMKF